MKKILLLVFQGLLILSCQTDTISNFDSNKNETEAILNQHGSVEGMLVIKFQDDVLHRINGSINEVQLPTGDGALDEYLHTIGAYKLKRVFPYAGKHESQQIENNLHAWYTVWIDKDKVNPSTRTTAGTPINRKIISYIEPVFEPVLQSFKVYKTATTTATDFTTQPLYNDPLFYKQWNLLNMGTVGNYTLGEERIESSVKGADVNIIPAWRQESGKPEVVIAILDGGIDVNHEDLKENIWINTAEIPDNGIDDDNNGFVDDVYGFNFVDETGILKVNEHGTHVAGVIAAKNNNGIGISSIAGGDGTPNSGVRIMNCQIFKDNPDWDPFDPDSKRSISATSNLTAAAIVYSANNGAVISQNSWGYDVGIPTPKVVKEAIDYFIKNAGRNEHRQAPMEGGIVIFAASNDEIEQKTYPAGEPNVITVAAYAPNFTAAWYTNYGNWIDLSAPGGSDKVGLKYPHESGEMTSGVYSTLPSEHGVGQYGFMEGTSMACPHVSGIAGLIVSKYGGENFTNKDLKKRLLASTKKINPDNYNKPLYHGKVGRGFIDAEIALTDYNPNMKPAEPQFIDELTKADYHSITIAWKATPTTNKDTNIENYILYLSETPLTESNYKASGVKQYEVLAKYATDGEVFTKTIADLSSGKKYYVALQSFTINGNGSKLITRDAVETDLNTPPKITPNIDLSKEFVLAGNDIQEINFKIVDAEGHKWDYELTYANFIFSELTEANLRIRIFANKFTIGAHTILLTVTDEHGGVSTETINIRIVKDNPPRPIENLTPFSVNLREQKTLSLKDFVLDEEPESLTFDIENLDNDFVNLSLVVDQLTIYPKQQGKTELTFTTTDKHNQKTTITIPIYIYTNTGIYSLYPTVATKVIYLRVGDVIDGKVKLRVRNIMGKEVLKEEFNTGSIDPIKRTIAIDIDNLFPGKYELSIINGGESYSENFIKE